MSPRGARDVGGAATQSLSVPAARETGVRGGDIASAMIAYQRKNARASKSKRPPRKADDSGVPRQAEPRNEDGRSSGRGTPGADGGSARPSAHAPSSSSRYAGRAGGRSSRTPAGPSMRLYDPDYDPIPTVRNGTGPGAAPTFLDHAEEQEGGTRERYGTERAGGMEEEEEPREIDGGDWERDRERDRDRSGAARGRKKRSSARDSREAYQGYPHPHAHGTGPHHGPATGPAIGSSVPGGGGGAVPSRQLFDPRRHDPVRFSIQKRNSGGASSTVGGQPAGQQQGAATSAGGYVTASATSVSDTRSIGSSALTFASTSAPSAPSVVSKTSSDASREKRRRRAKGEGSSAAGRGGATSTADGEGQADDQAGAPNGGDAETSSAANSFVRELKRAYREIMALESKLQEEHRVAAAAAAGHGGDHNKPRVVLGGDGLPEGLDVRAGAGTSTEVMTADNEYWIRLAQGHKNLAEAHYTFLQMALNPRLPASLHSLPQKYNVPTRLWQNAFHQLLERMRHHLPQAPQMAQATPSQLAVLDHLTDFIYYAYSFYTNLLEEPAFASFRSAWIESLGDLARYRMAIAGLAASVTQSQTRNGSSRRANPPSANGGGGDDRLSPSQPTRFPRIDDDENEREPSVEAPSIGEGAWVEWEVEERETWRNVARDWYAKGLAEMPGTGRLHHHLGILCRQDDLRSLYHFCKSLTTTHPFLSARESILPLFDTEQQIRRTRPDASTVELFVHLHCMLFTRVQLDDFHAVFSRFIAKLREPALALDAGASVSQARPLPQAAWIMMAVVNITALLQYGAEDGALCKCLAEGETQRRSKDSGGASQTDKASTVTPQALLVHTGPSSASSRSVKADEDNQGVFGAGEEDGEQGQGSDVGGSGGSGEGVVVVGPGDISSPSPGGGKAGADVLPLDQSLASSKERNGAEEPPSTFRHACQLAFAMLDFALSHPTRPYGLTRLVNPYITTFFTFLSTVLRHPSAVQLLERQVPWERVAQISGALPSNVGLRTDAPSKIVGARPLPEDWCLRGMEWVGRKVFERGFWRTSGVHMGGREGASIRPASQAYESEMDVLTFDDRQDGLLTGEEVDGIVEDEEIDHERDRLPDLRWKRLGLTLSALARIVPGLKLEQGSKRISIGGEMASKLERWKAEEEEEKKAARLEAERTSQRMGKLAIGEEEEEEDGEGGESNNGSSSEGEEEEEEEEEEDDDDDDDDATESEMIRELKARRRHLKALLKEAKTARTLSIAQGRRRSRTDKSAASSKQSSSRQQFHPGRQQQPQRRRPRRTPVTCTAGYTTLVVDTNILLTPGEYLGRLLDSEKWTVVVPLAVITELDGLKRSGGTLGEEAARAVAYLESKIRGCRFLKVVTSEGNRLRDLGIRNENIDFGENERSMDQVILRVAGQQAHQVVQTRGGGGGDDGAAFDAAVPAALVSFDRNLRLKATAQGIAALDERDLALVLSDT